MKNKKGFTLIELLAVIVILAIIALIATPIVLNMINDARMSTQKTSVNNIIRAAELYYGQETMSAKKFETTVFDLSDENNGLDFKGQSPNGLLIIYSDGSTLLNARFDDGNTYIKFPDKKEVESPEVAIGDSKTWSTDGNGTITGYKGEIGVDADEATLNFKNYLLFAYNYGTTDQTNSKSLTELIKEKEDAGDFSRARFTDSLNRELDIVIEDMNVMEAISEVQIYALLSEYQTTAPNVVDAFNKINNGDSYLNFSAYNVIKASMTKESKEIVYFVIPNQVKHEDGTIEQIKTIGNNAFSTKLRTEAEEIIPIISEGLVGIGSDSFFSGGLKNIIFANSIKIIGARAFQSNYLAQIYLPSKLETIGDAAFNTSGVKGKLVIPSNVVTIGNNAFRTSRTSEIDLFNCADDDISCKQSVAITELIFEENSKIETIGNRAFEQNFLTKIIIPESIKSIGTNAFYENDLNSPECIIIKKSDSTGLTLGGQAFGPVVQNYHVIGRLGQD